MTDTETIPTYGWYADGTWHEPGDRPLFDDFEPYTGTVYARIADCGPDEAKIAIQAAADAFPAWAATPPAEKARLFFKAAEIVRRRRTEIAEALARETGSTIPFSTFQQDLVAATLEQAAGWVYQAKGEVLAWSSRRPCCTASSTSTPPPSTTRSTPRWAGCATAAGAGPGPTASPTSPT